MLSYLKYLVQLLLSPLNGWEDLADTNPDSEKLLRRGFYPLLAITAATEFIGLFYNKGIGIDVFIIRAIIDLGAFSVALYLSRLVMEAFVRPLIASADAEVARNRLSVAVLMAFGEMLLIQILRNALQADITILKFMPLYIILILYKAEQYLNIKPDEILRFTLLASLATLAVPALISYILSLILLG